MEIFFILVEPAVPANVGAAARAIKTMGFQNLRLVRPCDYQSIEAKMLAHGSIDLLDNALVFDTLEDAIKDIDFIIGTSAKTRTVKLEYHQVDELPVILREKGSSISSVAMVFGREESGLTNDEIRLCDSLSSIPMKQSYPSINLAQAVMIYAYTLSDLVSGGHRSEEGIHIEDGNNKEAVNFKNESLKELRYKVEYILEDLGMSENPNIFNRIIERLMLAGETDINLLHSISRAYFDAHHPEK